MEELAVGTPEVGLEEGLLFTSLKTQPTRVRSSPEGVPRVEHPILRRGDPELHSCITWFTRTEHFLLTMAVSTLSKHEYPTTRISRKMDVGLGFCRSRVAIILQMVPTTSILKSCRFMVELIWQS